MKKRDLKLIFTKKFAVVFLAVLVLFFVLFFIPPKNSLNEPQQRPMPINRAVVYYPFDGNANDASGNGINAIVNKANLITGKKAQAYNFDGTSSYIKIPDNDKLSLSNAVSVSAWVKHNTGSPKKYENIIMKKDFSYGLQFSSTGDGKFIFHIKQKGGAPRNVISNVKPTTGVWYHVVGTYDGNIQKIYINGKLNNQASWKGSITSGLNPAYIGLKLASDNNYLNGAVDDVKIWNYALADSEVLSEYNSGTGTCTPNCAGKNCGDNGCAGTCGTCASGQSCVGGKCATGAGTLSPLYRLHNSNSFLFTASETEKNNAVSMYGYIYDGIVGYIYTKQTTGTTPLYRLHNSNSFLFTASETEKNNAVSMYSYIYDGIVGYIYTKP